MVRTFIAVTLVGLSLGFAGWTVGLIDAELWRRLWTSQPPSAITNEVPPRTEGARTEPEEVVGEWQDTIGAWTQRIRIVKRGGDYLRETHYPTGRVDRDYLDEMAPETGELRRFRNPSSGEGTSYAITRIGHLVIYDKQGFVAQARPVSTKRGEQE